MVKKSSFTLVVLFLLMLKINSQTTYDIRLNQIGFLPNAIKYAAIIGSESDEFEVKTSDLATTVFTGQLSKEVYFSASEENIKIADFTVFDTPGDYVLVVDDLGTSVTFTIGQDIFMSLSRASIKAFYYNRATMALETQYAGVYARALGHPDDAVVVLPSAASAERPAGTIISTPYGWYDAGDYNKYIVNSGISTFTLLSAYETYPDFYDTLTWNIPESGNAIPDILDEALWNIKWMMTMQDTVDGGVYNKTTAASFESFVMPVNATSIRYVVAKGTAATLDFAAVMAMVARIYKNYLPDLADQALEQAEKAWIWAKANPNVPFNNPGAEDGYPSVGTGGYGDSNFSDEFAWCAAELYLTTKDESYYSELDLENDNYDVPGWGNVRSLGLLSMIVNRKSLTAIADTALAISKLLDVIESSKNNTNTTAYRIPGEYFGWGGNSSYANRGMLMMQAFNVTGDAGYFNAAISTFDYLLGRNATTYCFVTGFGSKSPMNIHHRPSGADGITEPIPGFLAGGANPGNVNDDCGASEYPSTLPAKAYVDKQCSYSTNEIAINWNAPLAFLAGAIQYEYLIHFIDSMPSYLIVSSKNITLPYKAGTEVELTFSTNLEWKLEASEEWLGFSIDSGMGSRTIYIFSETDNLSNDDRYCKLYVYNHEIIVDSIMITQNGRKESFLIQAEDYLEMVGLQTEATTDLGGGLNIGYVDPGDWVSYTIDISYEGVYEVSFRHAGQACDLDVSIDSVFQKNLSFPATGGWQDWTTATAEMSFYEGVHTLRFDFNQQGLNLNWMNFIRLRDLDPIVINIVENNNKIDIYPVPAKKALHIDFKDLYENIDIILMSMDGKIVLRKTFSGVSHGIIDLSEIHNGIYILLVNVGLRLYNRKIIVEK